MSIEAQEMKWSWWSSLMMVVKLSSGGGRRGSSGDCNRNVNNNIHINTATVMTRGRWWTVLMVLMIREREGEGDVVGGDGWKQRRRWWWRSEEKGEDAGRRRKMKIFAEMKEEKKWNWNVLFFGPLISIIIIIIKYKTLFRIITTTHFTQNIYPTKQNYFLS